MPKKGEYFPPIGFIEEKDIGRTYNPEPFVLNIDTDYINRHASLMPKLPDDYLNELEIFLGIKVRQNLDETKG